MKQTVDIATLTSPEMRMFADALDALHELPDVPANVPVAPARDQGGRLCCVYAYRDKLGQQIIAEVDIAEDGTVLQVKRYD